MAKILTNTDFVLYNIYSATANQCSDTDITKLKRLSIFEQTAYISTLPKNEKAIKCRNNNSDNPLSSRRTDGGKSHQFLLNFLILWDLVLCTLLILNFSSSAE